MQSFVSSEAFVDWWPIECGCIHLCRFDPRHYSTACFERLGIEGFTTVRQAVPKRQAEYLAGRHCAARVLQRLDSPSTHVGTGIHRNPLWPDGVSGSISHSDSLALACASNSPRIAGLGIDLEAIPSEATARTISALVLSPAERERLECRNLPFALLVALVFSLKESFFKAAYPRVGDYFGFEAVEVERLAVDGGSSSLRLRQDLGRGLRRGQRFVAHCRRLERTHLVTFVELRNGGVPADEAWSVPLGARASPEGEGRGSTA